MPEGIKLCSPPAGRPPAAHPPAVQLTILKFALSAGFRRIDVDVARFAATLVTVNTINAFGVLGAIILCVVYKKCAPLNATAAIAAPPTVFVRLTLVNEPLADATRLEAIGRRVDETVFANARNAVVRHYALRVARTIVFSACTIILRQNTIAAGFAVGRFVEITCKFYKRFFLFFSHI